MATDERWRQLGDAFSFMNLDAVEFREYQLNIIKAVQSSGNTLVVLPTGLGKTLIGAGVMAGTLAKGRKALILAPTRPLSEQHQIALSRLMNIGNSEILLLTGSLKKEDRRVMEKSARIIVATPQTVANDLKNGILSLDGFGTVIFDECHRAVGKYAYTYVANECSVRDMMVVGLTASPGSKKERVNALVKALGIRHIEARIATDKDVEKYVMQKNVHVVRVDLTARIREISELLKPEIQAALKSINNMGFFHFSDFEHIPKGRLIDLGNQLGKIEAMNYRLGAMFVYSKLINLTHAYDLLTTEGIYPFNSYIESLYARDKKSKSLESLLKTKPIIAARDMSGAAIKNGEEHPKVFALLDVLRRYKGSKAIVFAQYRSTVKMLSDFISNNGFSARPFVGKKEGVTQEQQKRSIMDFREGKFDVLVASSIGEEGIDIPGVDIVVFYEPVPNEIRNIQRRGRTGRFNVGDIYILSANNTKDQIYLRISEQKEAKMLKLLNEMEAKLRAGAAKGQSKLGG